MCNNNIKKFKIRKKVPLKWTQKNYLCKKPKNRKKGNYEQEKEGEKGVF